MIRKTRLNYHLHRKIVVIDGKIGWTGGFNVGDQYLNVTEKFGYWRDTHIRLVGTAVFSLQEIFIMDWNASVKYPEERMTYHENILNYQKIMKWSICPYKLFQMVLIQKKKF